MQTHDQDLALSQRTVRDIMQTSVRSVTADMPLAEAARILWEHGISGAPVMDRNDRPIGMLAASDIVRVKGFGVRNHAVVGDVMTQATLAVRTSTTLPELAQFLTRANVHRALVMERGDLVGIVSTSDITREIATVAALDAERAAIV